MKIKTFFLFFIAYLVTISFINKTTYSQTGWTQLPSPSNTADLFGIYFKDILNGITYEYRTTKWWTDVVFV
jgi:hypothetical protein